MVLGYRRTQSINWDAWRHFRTDNWNMISLRWIEMIY